MSVIQRKIWDAEFLREKMGAMREGFRREYDRINELRDAEMRKMYKIKYKFFYCATKDEVKIENLPIPPDDVESLPNEPRDTKEFRFYKTPLEHDKDLVKNIKKQISNLDEDIKQLKSQMDAIDTQVKGGEVQTSQGTQYTDGIDEKIESYRTVRTLLKDYIRRL